MQHSFLADLFAIWQFMQVSCGQGGEKLLGLAEGLLRKHISTHSLHEPEGFYWIFPLFLSFSLFIGMASDWVIDSYRSSYGVHFCTGTTRQV